MSLSSEETAQSKVPKELLELGKALAKEVGAQDGVDTLGRWMTHYLAEQLLALEHATGTKKSQIESRVARLITEIWKHRGIQRDYPLSDFQNAAVALNAIVAGNRRWVAPSQPPHTASLALQCFEQVSLLASLGVLELLPAEAPNVPPAMQKFLDAGEQAFLGNVLNIYDLAAELRSSNVEDRSESIEEMVSREQLTAIASLESLLAKLRSLIESRTQLAETTPADEKDG